MHTTSGSKQLKYQPPGKELWVEYGNQTVGQNSTVIHITDQIYIWVNSNLFRECEKI